MAATSLAFRPARAHRGPPVRALAGPGLCPPQWRWLWRNCRLAACIYPGGQIPEWDHAGRELAAVQGNPTKSWASSIGPTVKCDGVGDCLEWSKGHDAYDGNITLALVVQLTGFWAGGTRIIGTSSATNGAFNIEVSGSGAPMFSKGAVANVTPGFALSANVPYFLAESYRKSDGTIRFLAARLDTGVVATDTQTNTQAATTGDKIWNLGGSRVFPNNLLQGHLGAGWIVYDFFDFPQLRAWAADPWGMFRLGRRVGGIATPQIARPDADVSAGAWAREDGSATSLYVSIDEAPPPDDADYIASTPTPVSETTEIALGPLSVPAVGGGRIVRYRFGKDAAFGDRVDLTVEVYQGATPIASWVHVDIPSGWTTVGNGLSAAQEAAITDYTDLRLRFTASRP